jgi:hypothetical protein
MDNSIERYPVVIEIPVAWGENEKAKLPRSPSDLYNTWGSRFGLG